MTIDRQGALIYTMVLVAAAEGQIHDQELETIGRMVRTLPAFRDFDTDRLIPLGRECAELLAREDGLDRAMEMIEGALTPGLRETAYALACDVAAADGKIADEEIRLLEWLRHSLDVNRLVAAAIERAAQARHRRVDD